MKYFSVFFLTLLMCLFLLSCKQALEQPTDNKGFSTEQQQNADTTSVGSVTEYQQVPDSLSLSDLKPRDAIVIHMTKDNAFSLEGFSLLDGVYLETKNLELKTSSSKALGGTNGWLYTLVENELLACPNESGYLPLVVSAINTPSDKPEDSAVITIRKFDIPSTMAITPEDNPTGDKKLIEKYYRVNLDDKKWDYLNKKEVAIIQGRTEGAVNMDIFFGEGRELSPEAIFNLEERGSFTIYHNIVGTVRDRYPIVITSPITIGTKTEIPNEICVVKIPAATNSEERLVTVNMQREDILQLQTNMQFLDFDTRKADGTHVGYIVTPAFDSTSNTMKLHVPPTDYDLYLTLRMDKAKNPATATIGPYKSGMNTTRINLNTFDKITVKAGEVSKEPTFIPIEFQGKVLLSSTLNSRSNAYLMYENKGGSGSLTLDKSSIKLDDGDSTNAYGFILIYTRTNLAEEGIIFTLQKGDYLDIPCSEVVWDSSKQVFVCHNCALHPTTPEEYEATFYTTNREKILSGIFQTPKSYGKYGRIKITDGRLDAENLHLNSGSLGDINGELGYYEYDTNNTDTFVDFRFKSITRVGDKKEITGILSVGGVVSKEPVTFIQE